MDPEVRVFSFSRRTVIFFWLGEVFLQVLGKNGVLVCGVVVVKLW